MSQMNGMQLDRAGIFKARPYDWSVQPSQNSKSVAVSMGFLILEELEGSEWVSWANTDPYVVRGWWYVIGREGKINTTAVEQLAKSLGWDGDLAVVGGEPPDKVVQIVVKTEEYEGKSRTKATWMNPEDYTPEFGGASSEDVSKLKSQFGSLLKAAAAGATKGQKPPAKAPKRGVGGSAGNAPTTDGKEPPVKDDYATFDKDIPF